MIDPLAAAGLVSAIFQFVAIANRLVGRLNDFRQSTNRVPKMFRKISDELPLLIDTLRRTQNQADAGHIGGETAKALKTLVEGCLAQLEQLEHIIAKALPCEKDSPWSRRFKALASLAHDKTVQQIAAELESHVRVLTYHQATRSTDLSSQLALRGAAQPLNLIAETEQESYYGLAQATLQSRVTDGKTSVLFGSAIDGTTSLCALCPDIHRIILSHRSEVTQAFPPDIASWFLSELYALLANILEDEARQPKTDAPKLCSTIQIHRTDFPNCETVPPISPLSIRLRTVRGYITARCFPRSMATISSVETTLLEANISTGNIYMAIKREFAKNRNMGTKGKVIIGRVLFLPGERSPLVGISINFMRLIDNSCRISRTLSTFGVHPDCSLIFEYLKAGDVAMVRKMLSEGEVCPNDRDKSGNSLLWYTLSNHYNYEMCSLLLDKGADASDCNIDGDHALAILVSNLPVHSYGKANITEDVMILTERLLKKSQSEVYGRCQYKRRQTIEHGEASLLHCALRRQNCNIRILELVKLTLKSGIDLEARDINGNTPLLYALYYTPEFQLVEVANTLIGYGANLKAVNNYGEGCLHLLLRRLSACNNYNMCSETASSLIDILVVLLNNGCSPALSNIKEYTPIDAALSPTAWPLFCCALERAGKSINEILAIDCTMQSYADIKEKSVDIVVRNAQTTSHQQGKGYSGMYTGQPCSLCGRHTDWKERQMPFDEFMSHVVEELGFGIHMKLFTHHDMSECLKVQEEDSCHSLDYHPGEMSLHGRRKRSLNRQVAYMMWREGILRTPLDCQRWAVRSEGM